MKILVRHMMMKKMKEYIFNRAMSNHLKIHNIILRSSDNSNFKISQSNDQKIKILTILHHIYKN